jgi:PAS domain S-box-containing protein
MNKKVVKVLSIEDNPADALLIQEQLAKATQMGWDLPHFEVERVSHLEAGLSYLGEKEFDVVLSDLDLPDSQAGETVAALREFVPQMPIVVLTGREDNELAQGSVRAGVQDYLYKDEATGSLMARAMMYAIERQQAHENLEQCVVERTAELRDANQKLQAEIAERARVEEALLESRSRVRHKLRSILSPDGALGPLELSDIIDVEAIQALMDDFYELTNTGVAIVDMKGEVLVATGWQDICTQFHRVHPVTSQYCIESDTALSSGIEPGEYKLYKCKNNMWDMATPIVVGGQHVGNLFLGQFFFDDETVDRETFRKQAQKYGFDEEEYLAALDRVPQWPRERVETVFRFYAQFAKMVSRLSHSNLKLAQALAEKDRLLAAHKDSEQKFKSYIEHAPYGVFVADEEGRYVEVNEAASRLTGYDRAELLNMHIRQLVFPDYHQVVEEHFQTVTEEGFATDESPFVMKDGNTRWWSVSTVRLSEKRFLAYVEDITERKQAEDLLRESEERYRLLFESSPDAIALIGLEGKVLDCNPATSKLAGLPLEEIIGKHLNKLGVLEEVPLPRYIKVFSRLISGRVVERLELKTKRSNGQTRWIEAFAQPIVNEGKIQAIQVIARDITERKRAEEEIARYATELKRSNQELEQFGYIVSHDLQAPLRAVRSYLQLLMKRYRGQIDPKADEYISSAVDGTDRMQDMIKALLDLSRVKTRGKEFEPTDCEVVLEHVLDDLAPTIEEGGAAVTYGPLPTVMADKAQLAQVFQNLIANGIKFRREDVPPRVHIAAERVGDDEWIFSVEDNGIGISQEKLELIFQIFQRLHTEEEYPGLGIGLALCKRIVERHGGRIWVESQLGQGAKFYFTIPVRET